MLTGNGPQLEIAWVSHTSARTSGTGWSDRLCGSGWSSWSGWTERTGWRSGLKDRWGPAGSSGMSDVLGSNTFSYVPLTSQTTGTIGTVVLNISDIYSADYLNRIPESCELGDSIC